MTALKGEAVGRFLKRPDKPVALVYGPDTGLVGERARAIIDGFLGPDADPMARAVIEGDGLPGAPERLAEEAHSVPMFGGRRAIRVPAGSKNILPAVQPLLSDPPREAIVVIEGGDLKPSSPLRKAIEKSDQAVAIPCYVDDARAVETLVTEEMAAAGLQVSPDARAALTRLLGGDRLASRGELRKLATYCHGRERVEIEDVGAVVGDASALELDVLIDSTAVGDAGQADLVLRRCLAAGTAPGSVVSALSRHFMQLSEARLKIDRGATADAAMRELRPPVFFKRQNGFRRQLGLWSPEALGRALELIAATEASVRLEPDLADAMTSRALITLAGAARGPRQGR
ncbi:DNA polymerase III subunit delta [Microbaculum sp. FT89]|uniref:DNA polymerase III subunit delta n=1 Tax=Microbaculum sp. FT89 TaxID=3447298 RepID=UPI003F53C73E